MQKLSLIIGTIAISMAFSVPTVSAYWNSRMLRRDLQQYNRQQRKSMHRQCAPQNTNSGFWDEDSLVPDVRNCPAGSVPERVCTEGYPQRCYTACTPPPSECLGTCADGTTYNICTMGITDMCNRR